MTDIVYYELVRKTITIHPEQLCTAAVWSCNLCGETISGMGGPGEPCDICENCGKDILNGRLTYNREEEGCDGLAMPFYPRTRETK
jgi:hypothetical protein